MNTLRDKILHALYGGALVTTALGAAACGSDETSGTTGQTSAMTNSSTSATNTSSTANTNNTNTTNTGGGTTTVTATQTTQTATSNTNTSSTSTTNGGTSTSGTATSTNNTSTNNTSTSTGTGTATATATATATSTGTSTTGPTCDPMGKKRVTAKDFFGGGGVIGGNKLPPGEYILCNDSKTEFACKDPSGFDNATKQSFVNVALSTSCAQGTYNVKSSSGKGQGTFCGPVADPNKTSKCCYVVDTTFLGCVVVGRPFTIEGIARLAQVAQREGWCDDVEVLGLEGLPHNLREELAMFWAEGGIHEHASVASFARFLMDLMSMGAPRRLVAAATKAIDDEIRHASACFAIASAYAGQSLGPAEFDMTGSMEHAGDKAEILRSAIMEGCIGETLAASVAGWQAQQVTGESVREVLGQIASDESDHALLAWEFVQWMLIEHPELMPVAQEAFAFALEPFESQWLEGTSESERVAIEHGKVRLATEERLHRRALAQIVAPCAQALFEGLGAQGEWEARV